MKPIAITFGLTWALNCVCVAKPKPVTFSEAKESAAAVFVYLMKKGTVGGGWYPKGDAVYVQAIANGRDVTSKATLKYYRIEGVQVHPGWASKKNHPKGGYWYIGLSNPVNTPEGIKWEVQRWGITTQDSEYDNSLAQMWIWMKKEGSKWRSIKTQGGVTAG